MLNRQLSMAFEVCCADEGGGEDDGRVPWNVC